MLDIKVKKRFFFSLLILVSDIIAIYLAFGLAYYLRFNMEIIPADKGVPGFPEYQRAIFLVMVIWVIIFTHIGMYRSKTRASFDELFLIIRGVTTGTVILLAGTFFYRGFSYSRAVTIFAWLDSIIFIFFFHQVLKVMRRLLFRRFLGTENVLVAGSGKLADSIKGLIKKDKLMKYYYTPELDGEKISSLIKKRAIDELILAKSPVQHSEVLNLSKVCEELGVGFRFVPDILELKMGELIVDNYFSLPLLRMKSVSLHGINFYIKRAMDIFISLTVVSLLSPLLTLIALLIKLDSPGPIFHKQKRLGFLGREFSFYKFRTMITEAEDILKEIKHLSERKGPVFKMKKDPRVTRVGAFLRRYSLDELPQIFNVLQGNMSLIGPRPQVIWETESYDDMAKRRLRLLPGITGLWQVSGRSDLSFEEMIKLDIYYLENWSIGLDIKILLRTIPVVFTGKGAY